MKLSELNIPMGGKSKKKGMEVESTCQYLSACGIPYQKKFREDDTGADFTLKSADVVKEVFQELKNHHKIQKNFVIKLDKNNNKMIRVYFRD